MPTQIPTSLTLNLCIVLSAITKAQPILLSLSHSSLSLSQNMAELKNSSEEKNPFVAFFSNFLSAIKLPFPFPPKKNGEKSEPSIAISQKDEPVIVKPAVVEDNETNPPNFVTLPRQSYTPIKLEAEADEAERSTNPLLLWQVYAIGGFLVLRWAWIRWNERKGKKKPDDEPPSARD